MNKVVEKIVGLSVLVLLLLVTISIGGYACEAAITTSIAVLGGLAEKLGELGVLGLLKFVTSELSLEYAFYKAKIFSSK